MISFFHFKRQGRNNQGRITVRHRGSGLKISKPNFSYFKPNFKTFKLASINFPKLQADLRLTISSNFKPNVYNLFYTKSKSDQPRYLFEFAVGQFLSEVELLPSKGPKFCRSPGSRCQLLRKRGTYATIKFPSGELRRLSVFCSARPGNSNSHVFSHFSQIPVNTRKAGFTRNLGIRPHVRGCAINPIDHPHGGRTGESRPSVSPWGQLTKGYRTRFRKVNKKFVLFSVQAIKNKLRLSANLNFFLCVITKFLYLALLY